LRAGTWLGPSVAGGTNGAPPAKGFEDSLFFMSIAPHLIRPLRAWQVVNREGNVRGCIFHRYSRQTGTSFVIYLALETRGQHRRLGHASGKAQKRH